MPSCIDALGLLKVAHGKTRALQITPIFAPGGLATTKVERDRANLCVEVLTVSSPPVVAKISLGRKKKGNSQNLAIRLILVLLFDI